MQITRAGEYAVLGLMHLARRPAGQVAMIDEVSRGEQIPRSFLAKIFQHLARGGLVRSIRGAGGGFVLARAAAHITVLEIVESVEGKMVSPLCKLAKPDCKHAGGCALCGLFEQAQDGLKDVLVRTTLWDLVRQQNHLELIRVEKIGSRALKPGRRRG
jgi:Rrf2 family protein